MRVSILTRSLTRGGAERQVVALATGLARRGHDVSVVCFYGDGPLAAGLGDSSVKLVELGKTGRFSTLGPLRRLVAHLRKNRTEVAYSFLPMENLFGLFATGMVRRPIVWGIRGASVNRNQFGMASRVLYGLQFRLLPRANAVISNSFAAEEELNSRNLPELHVVPNGIDVERFSPSQDRRDAWRHKHGFRQDEVIVGIVARLDPMKDHRNFLRAAALVARDVAAARFVVAGGGPVGYFDSLRQFAKELGLDGRLTWLDEVSDPSDVYRGIDVLVSASAWGEGFSNVLGEAMATGVTVVATDIGDSRRIVGSHGRVVEAKRPEALASAIIDVLGFDSAESRLARRLWIENQFGVEAMVTRTEGILARVAGPMRSDG